MQPGQDGAEVGQVLAEFLARVERDRPSNIGFPGATDFDYAELTPFLGILLNNVGDPYISGVGSNHSKDFEVEVIDFLADLFAVPHDDRWGYVTTGGSEANLYALLQARELLPNGLVFCSAAAHDSVRKAVDLLRMSCVTVRADATGEIDYDDLRSLLGQYRDRPAIVVANIGTTMTEAVDDIARIKDTLSELAITDYYIHADAALAGIPRALDADDDPNVALSLTAAHSICVSGHKLLGSPVPCGVVLTRDSLRRRISRPGTYTGSPDTTITGSRSGLAPLMLWYRLHQLGWKEGLRKRVASCRELAEYTHRRLVEIGWETLHNPGAFTVVLKTPPVEIMANWTLASHDGWSHVVCMPGVDYDDVDRFVEAVRASQSQWVAPPRKMLRARAAAA